jgi:uncharacterized protein YbjT (DUF2867 family)
MGFRVVIIGGTGQVGGAVVRALLAEPSCADVVMVNRRSTDLPTAPRLRQVVMDTASARFVDEVEALARFVVAQGDRVVAASCVGVGSGSLKWSEDELKALELGVVGGFARGCRAGVITQFALLSAAGSNAHSRIRYSRVMGMKEDTVRDVGFPRLAIFRPGIIAGNAHTPAYASWLGRFIPFGIGTIEQDDIARAFVAEFARDTARSAVVSLDNVAMRRSARGSGARS